MADHRCERNRTCTCSTQGLEPDDDCPIHGGGEWPPRCATCGRLMRWPEPFRDATGEMKASDMNWGVI